MSLRSTIAGLGLPLDSLIVTGSGLLEEYGLREANDVDIIVTQAVFDDICQTTDWKSYQIGADKACGRDGIEVWQTWYGSSYEDVYQDSVQIDGLRFMSPQRTIQWKSKLGRQKDIDDIAMLEEYCRHA